MAAAALTLAATAAAATAAMVTAAAAACTGATAAAATAASTADAIAASWQPAGLLTAERACVESAAAANDECGVGSAKGMPVGSTDSKGQDGVGSGVEGTVNARL